jgi:1-hydroxycarotenoid 3,4-desaturase
LDAPIRANVSRTVNAGSCLLLLPMSNAAIRATEPTHAVVVGAGVAGMSAAIALRAHGATVRVVESSSAPGGKMRELLVAGIPVDSGPTVLTMPWVFTELFANAGLNFADYVSLDSASVLARHVWPDGSRLDLLRDLEPALAELRNFGGARAADEYLAYTKYCAAIWQVAETPFIRSQRPTLWSMLGDAKRLGLRGSFAIDAHRTFWSSVCAHFTDPRLRQLFGRYATYTGSSPFAAPATLNVIAHVERDGVYVVRGGMQRLAEGLARACADLDIPITYGCTATAIDYDANRKQLAHVHTSADTINANVLVWAGDVAALAKLGAAGQRAANNYRFPLHKRSLSAVTYSMVAQFNGFPLARHTVFFSADYPREFDDIVRHGRVPHDPTVYACAQDRDEQQPIPTGPERVFFIVNAPACGDGAPLTDQELEQCDSAFYRRLENSGLCISQARSVRTAPHDFHARFPHTGGALYGLASHGMMSALARPGARTTMRGVYLASGSIHPGAGVPMAAMSGRLAAMAATADGHLRVPS